MPVTTEASATSEVSDVVEAPAPTRKALKRDAVLAAAVDQAREAAIATSGLDDVGEHLGYTDDAERLGTHYFATTSSGYRGWRWTVTVARIARSRVATVCEVELLPGDDALLAPAWVPWSDRLAPGDVGPTDVLPDDVVEDRLVPGYTPRAGDPVDVATVRDAIIELGAWRAAVPSRETLQAAATRWERNLPARGRSFVSDPTAFIIPLTGVLGQVYGVCVNEFSPDDGKVVRLDQVGQIPVPVERPFESAWPDSAPFFDEFELDTDE